MGKSSAKMSSARPSAKTTEAALIVRESLAHVLKHLDDLHRSGYIHGHLRQPGDLDNIAIQSGQFFGYNLVLQNSADLTADHLASMAPSKTQQAHLEQSLANRINSVSEDSTRFFNAAELFTFATRANYQRLAQLMTVIPALYGDGAQPAVYSGTFAVEALMEKLALLHLLERQRVLGSINDLTPQELDLVLGSYFNFLNPTPSFRDPIGIVRWLNWTPSSN